MILPRRAVVLVGLGVARRVAVEVSDVRRVRLVEEDAHENSKQINVREAVGAVKPLDVEAGEDDVARELGQLRVGGGRRREHEIGRIVRVAVSASRRLARVRL